MVANLGGEFDDVEASYRRGYDQGAHAALRAAERLLTTECGREKLREWVEHDLHVWRYFDRPSDRMVQPPDSPA